MSDEDTYASYIKERDLKAAKIAETSISPDNPNRLYKNYVSEIKLVSFKFSKSSGSGGGYEFSNRGCGWEPDNYPRISMATG